MEFGVPIFNVEAHVVAFYLSQLPALSAEATIVRALYSGFFKKG